jgi:hypothetical protein
LRTREWAAGIPFRGAWRPSGAPALQGRGGGHGAGAGGLCRAAGQDGGGLADFY